MGESIDNRGRSARRGEPGRIGRENDRVTHSRPIITVRYCGFLVCAFGAACGASSSGFPSDAGSTQRWRAEHVGPHTGFVSAVAFAPGSGSMAWISGDDASGVYRSTDGGTTVVPVTTSPLDWSTWRFAFGNSGQRIVAPAYYGRGVAMSMDSGATWRVVTDGVPQGASPEPRNVYDALITPTNDILLATGSGLYRSSDGERYSRVESSALETAGALTRIILGPSGYWLGSKNGRLYTSNESVTWTDLSGADGPEITDLAVGQQGTYVALAGGQLIRFSPAGNTEVLIDPTADTRFALADWVKVAIAPNGTKDRIYVGINVAVSSAQTTSGKLFVSDDGGATFPLRSSGLGGASIFQLALDPSDPAHVLAGTVGDGVFVTRDAGKQWVASTGDLRATAAIGFAQDPSDPSHIAMTSVDVGPGTPSLWERIAGTWKQRPALIEDAISLVFDDRSLIAGGGGTTNDLPAIRRSANGGDGPFVVEVKPNDSVLRLVRTSRGVYAAGDALRKRGAGGTWTTLRSAAPGVAFNDVAELPDGAILACGTDMLLSANGDFTDAIELAAPDKAWYACTTTASGVLVATSWGAGVSELWVAPDPVAARSAANWTRLATPLDHTTILSVVVVGEYWLIGGGDALDGATIQARSGIYASSDSGATWSAIDADMWPSRIAWRLHRGATDAEVFAPLWGGGLWRLTRADPAMAAP